MSSFPHDETQAQFVFVVCQKNAQDVCKQEIAKNHPDLRFAFSRRGIMTFKITEPSSLEFNKPFFLQSIFARTYGLSVFNLNGEIGSIKSELDRYLKANKIDQVHVWRRKEQDNEYSAENESEKEQLAEIGKFAKGIKVNQIAKVDQAILDLIEVDENRWLIGRHIASSTFHRWPAGKLPIVPKQEVISRAYYKTREGIQWGQLPIREGDVCAEIGAAPGGSSQALLEAGCHVIAVDPAKLDPSIADHPNVTHFKRRGKEVRKTEFAKVRWLFADLNVTPKYTLDTIEDIVASQNVNVRGMLLTLKLRDQFTSEELLAFGERVKNLGFRHVKLRPACLQPE